MYCQPYQLRLEGCGGLIPSGKKAPCTVKCRNKSKGFVPTLKTRQGPIRTDDPCPKHCFDSAFLVSANTTRGECLLETFRPASAEGHSRRTSAPYLGGLCGLLCRGHALLPSCKSGIKPISYAVQTRRHPHARRPSLCLQYHRVHTRTFLGGPCYTFIGKESA